MEIKLCDAGTPEKQKNYLGIEFGSTRIKSVLIGADYKMVASGSFTWESDYQNGVWTYALEDAENGLQAALADMKASLAQDVPVQAFGISGMMHGYLAFDREWRLLVPFRTWQNTTTRAASEELTALFNFNIPQRLSIAHLYQAILNQEPHLGELAHITTLAGYMHYRLTGENVICVDEASGMFPIDSTRAAYDADMLKKTEALFARHSFVCNLEELLPRIAVAGERAGTVTAAGSRFAGGLLPAGLSAAPPAGDGGTGMVATNSVAPRTGNVSVGTSIFADIVLEHPLKKLYPEIDIVTTPTGRPVAEVHGNNCTGDMNNWVRLFAGLLSLFGKESTEDELFTRLYQCSLDAEPDCGGITTVNYLAGEGITHLDDGRPLILRTPGADLTLSNFIRAQLYALFATLRIGIDVLADEHVRIDRLMGHGGVFRTRGVGQRYLAAACRTEVVCMENAGEGGPYGMALLAAFMMQRGAGQSLESFLAERVFSQAGFITEQPDEAIAAGFDAFLERFKCCLALEELAVRTKL